jgi:phage-related protein
MGIAKRLPSNRIARILFSVQQGKILILHGFIKKTQKTPDEDLALARKRNREFEPRGCRYEDEKETRSLHR